MRSVRTFLASFLVLFLEVALIRWMPAHIRLLSYFSNFILLASFLGIGIGCLLAPRRVRLFAWFPLLQAAVVAAVYFFRLEVAIPSSTDIFFSSGTAEKVTLVESTRLLPLLFGIVAALFVTVAERMGRAMASLPPLRGYTINLLGSLAGVGAFAVMSWQQLSPTVWFGVAFASALPLLLDGRGWRSRAIAAINLGLLVTSLVMVHALARGAIWSPYYKITVDRSGSETIISVNNIFHQSMARVDEKEYFYQWPYMAFGNTFRDVLILGAGSGTDVASALMHGAQRVDAVEIDPAIIKLGQRWHPQHPYQDPRVHVINDDARHFLRTSTRKYDLVVFALIDSLTLQSSFSGVRLESYMFTEESFRDVRAHLQDDGVLVIYNYFRERWLVDRLANTAAVAFGEDPYVHVHEAHSYLGVLMAGPRLHQLASPPAIPDRVLAYGQSHGASPGRRLQRDPSIEPASDDWPFLYMRGRSLPFHYGAVLAMVLVFSVAAVMLTLRGEAGAWSWQFFFLGAGFMLLETKSIIQFALLWGSTWVVASLAIASVLAMALAANFIVSRREIGRPWAVGAVLIALLAANYAIPIGRVSFESRIAESLFYAALQFSPILCAGLLFGSAIKRSTSVARDYGTNLLGAMVGGIAEYMSLVTGFRMLLVAIAACYVAALVARHIEARRSMARLDVLGAAG